MGTKPRVLIVEDEIIVALFMEDVLAEFGYEVAGVVGHLDEAVAREPDYDMAVLDVHLNGRSVFDFADALAVRGIALRLRHRLWRARHPGPAPGPAGAAKALPARGFAPGPGADQAGPGGLKAV